MGSYAPHIFCHFSIDCLSACSLDSNLHFYVNFLKFRGAFTRAEYFFCEFDGPRSERTIVCTVIADDAEC